MNDNELDKFLKQNLQGKIKPSQEFTGRMRNVIKIEQEKKKRQEEQVEDKKEVKKIRYNLPKIIPIAAMLVIVFTLAVVLYGENGQETSDVAITIRAIEPTKLKSGIVAEDSEFIIYTEENGSIESIQKSLYVEPALDYTIEKVKDNEYKLKFKQNIPDNTIVKLQYVKNQITENSWAYQSSTDLSVVDTFPKNKETDVSSKSVIEIEFSHADIDNFEENVSITPEVKGNWEHLGKIWRFTPTSGLEKNQNYKVVVKNGITSSEQKLKKEYVLEFSTFEQEGYCEYETMSVDKINNYKSNENVKMYYITQNAKVKTVKISKFENAEQFINYLNNGNFENAKSLGEYDFDIIERDYDKYIQLNKTLGNGYYVASIKSSSGKELFNCPIQINDLSAYVMESERDIITWIAKDNNLAQNIQVNYKEKTEKTNNQGYAILKKVDDNSEKVDYIKIGNDENKLVVGVYCYNTENYPKSYIYTDRPLYKNTDTINIWGMVPVNQFYEKIENEFYIQLGEGSKQKVNIDDNGNLNYQIKLENCVDENTEIKLYYKNSIIAERNVRILNYELQNYNYEVVINKNYINEGENISFDVKVKHITGILVPNKSVVISYQGKNYKQKTGDDGIAHFEIKATLNEDEKIIKRSGLHSEEINIYNGDSEEYNVEETGVNIYILARDVYTKIENKDNTYKVNLYNLIENKDIIIKENDEDEDLGISEIFDGTKYNTNVDIILNEIVTNRTIDGYEYNEYTKKQEPQYSYNTTENSKKLKTIMTQDGSFEFNKNDIQFKKNTEEQSYIYEIHLKYNDNKGREVLDSIYIGNESDKYENSYSKDAGYFYYHGFDDNVSSDVVPEIINTDSYYIYKYVLKTDKSKFSIGDTIDFTLTESLENSLKDIKNEGKVLRIVFKENINTVDFIENDNYNYTFKQEDFPGCKMTSAYFKDGKFYRMPVYYFDFNEEDRKVDIEIKSDKEKYAPGDEVVLNVKTTNNGNPIKSSVNLSVVNEAVFGANGNDETNILEQLYKEKDYPAYTYSSNTLNMGFMIEAGAGAGGNVRSDFGDTALFQTVETNSKGEATVKFKLPDNVTTYRVTAHSANKDLYVGVNTLDITSTLDFFVQSTEPRSIKETDDVVLNATSISTNNDEVKYVFNIKEINKQIEKTATSNSIVTANFGKLDCGIYHVTIKGVKGNDEDTIEYEFKVSKTMQEIKDKKTLEINQNTVIKPEENPIVLEIYNKNMKQYIDYIDFIEKTSNSRLDTIISYNEIQKYKSDYYKTQMSINNADIDNYKKENGFTNLPNGNEDIVLTALANFYGGDSYKFDSVKLTDDMNLFEYYLYCASNNEPVLTDLQYLKQEKDIDNYGKLLLSLSFEFLGDYSDGEELYKNINLSDEEKKEYSSIIAIIDTFINKENVTDEINKLIEENPSDEYLRFAILSYFKNNSKEMEKQQNVKITGNDLNEDIIFNNYEVKNLTIYNSNLDEIKFETSNDDLMVTYYYQTEIDNAKNDVSKNIEIKLNGNLKKDNEVKLVVNFENTEEGNVKIALPNSLRLANNASTENKNEQKYYYISNNIDYITLYKQKGCKKMEIPLLVTNEGQYVFESVVYNNEDVYNISNSLEINIEE